MKTSEFDYSLPNDKIATHPAEPRDAAKLLVLNRNSGELTDSHFYDLDKFLSGNDVLVLNDSKVIPARLSAKIGERTFEVLLVKQSDVSKWECWVRPGRKVKPGDIFQFSEKLTAKFLERREDIFLLEFNLFGSEFFAEVGKIGEMPIPPYIIKARDLEIKNSKLKIQNLASGEDARDYQTVFARESGSVAAPTAGLHFTDELLAKLHDKGVQIEKVTLHVSLGTFQPLNTDDVEDFQIHSEYFEIDPGTAERLNTAKSAGKRIVAVGTTAVRVLESAATDIKACGFINPGNMSFALLPRSGETSIYIFPGYEYKFVDAMITNFHLPKSSLLLLVSAFAGQKEIMHAYKYAIDNSYRFYSYGDGMFIY